MEKRVVYENLKALIASLILMNKFFVYSCVRIEVPNFDTKIQFPGGFFNKKWLYKPRRLLIASSLPIPWNLI
jgi:hypothetical protein